MTADHEGTILFVNRTLPGLPSEEQTLGMKLYDFVPPEKHDTIRASLERVFRTGDPEVFETLGPGPDGSTVWYETRVGSIKREGQVVAAVFIATDITDRKQAEENLRLSQERFRSAFDYAAIGMALVAPDGRWLAVNRVLCEIVGYAEGELLATTFQAITHPDDLETDLEYVRQMLAGTIRTYQLEKRYFHKQGHVVSILLSVSLVRDSKGIPLYFIAQIQNITDRKQAEEALRDSEQRYRTMIETANDMIWIVDTQGNFAFANQQAVSITGLEREDWIGKPFAPIVHPDDLEKVNRVFQETLAGKPQHYTTKAYRKDGQIMFVSVNTAPLREKGSIAGTVSFGRDITDQTLAEQALRKERDFNANLLQAFPTFFVAVSAEGKTLLMNDTMLATLGYVKDEIVGTNYLETFVPKSDRQLLAKIFEKLVDAKEPTLNENRVLTKDGRQLLVEWRGRPIFKENGEFDFFFGVGIDITERKRAELDLQKAFSEIRQLRDQLERDNILLREEIEVRYEHHEVIGKSDAINRSLAQVEQVADTDATVLLLGETGTGKEVLARRIHKLSGRKDRPMVTINCAALPSSLVESELFGREAGAYTGALSKQTGRFEVADGSTILLDEIGELPVDLQAKLLRVLEEGEFERLGSSKTISVDVRIMAATNRDLAAAVREGKFRPDLYHRLNVFPIQVPPLREHREDIPLLVWAFVKEFGEKMGKTFKTVPRKSMKALEEYSWPGNVRELRNVIERAVIRSKDFTLRIEVPRISDSIVSEPITLEECQRIHILSALERTTWRVRGKNGAAELLGLHPSTLESKMAKLGIKRRE